ncbi:hypothetical protein [Deinococcus arcticus]|uniref:Uncharacterized protein n=1 Tax=Deinococcus arcticus TaxID=2136176 RepID=A0A2T3W3R5_9DEIO|nr:hypothetical protein [Deinococcus arcticus]PTA66479.1 hypothetical protein C8263_17745 [Deinococcus arcticus]
MRGKLLVEKVEDQVAKLGPKIMKREQMEGRLGALQTKVFTTGALSITREAYTLFVQMGLKDWEANTRIDCDKRKLAVENPAPEECRVVASQFPGLWAAWWPGVRK